MDRALASIPEEFLRRQDDRVALAQSNDQLRSQQPVDELGFNALFARDVEPPTLPLEAVLQDPVRRLQENPESALYMFLVILRFRYIMQHVQRNAIDIADDAFRSNSVGGALLFVHGIHALLRYVFMDWAGHGVRPRPPDALDVLFNNPVPMLITGVSAVQAAGRQITAIIAALRAFTSQPLSNATVVINGMMGILRNQAIQTMLNIYPHQEYTPMNFYTSVQGEIGGLDNFARHLTLMSSMTSAVNMSREMNDLTNTLDGVSSDVQQNADAFQAILNQSSGQLQRVAQRNDELVALGLGLRRTIDNSVAITSDAAGAMLRLVENLYTNYHGMAQALADRQDDVQAARNRVEQMDDQLRSVAEQAGQRYSAQLHTERAEAQQRLAREEQLRREAESRMQQVVRRNDEVNNELRVLTNAHQVALRNVSQLDQTTQLLGVVTSQRNQLTDQLDKTNQQLQIQQRSAAQLQQQRDEMQQRIETLGRTMPIQAQAIERESADELIKDMSDELDRRNAVIEELHTRQSQLQLELNAVTSSRVSVEQELNVRLRTQAEQMQSHAQDIARMNQQTVELMGRNEVLTAELHGEREANAELRKRLDIQQFAQFGDQPPQWAQGGAYRSSAASTHPSLRIDPTHLGKTEDWLKREALFGGSQFVGSDDEEDPAASIGAFIPPITQRQQLLTPPPPRPISGIPAPALSLSGYSRRPRGVYFMSQPRPFIPLRYKRRYRHDYY